MLSCAILTVSGYGWAVTDAVDSATVRADVFGGLDGRPPDTPATDILIVGSDTRIGLGHATLDEFHAGSVASAAGARSDTMILAQLAADGKSLTLLSIPRDSYVDIPAWGGHPEHHNKINSALNLGGPGLAVATVERATGIHVDHFVQVDFSAFASIVDAVGGVDVCLSKAADDPNSGLRLPAGVSHVTGVQALAFVRARYTLTGGSDLGRIHRQQEFLGSLAERIGSSQVLADPSRFTDLVGSIASAVQTDSGLDTETLMQLALTAKNIPRARIRFVSMPLADPDHEVPGVGSTVLWDPALSGKLFDALRRDQPVDAVRVAPAAAASPVPAPAAPPASPASPAQSLPATTGPGDAVAGAAAAADQAHALPPPPTTLSVRSADQSICH